MKVDYIAVTPEDLQPHIDQVNKFIEDKIRSGIQTWIELAPQSQEAKLLASLNEVRGNLGEAMSRLQLIAAGKFHNDCNADFVGGRCECAQELAAAYFTRRA